MDNHSWLIIIFQTYGDLKELNFETFLLIEDLSKYLIILGSVNIRKILTA